MAPKIILGYRARTRSRILFIIGTAGVWLLVASAFQTALFGQYPLFGAVPDLMLVTVVCFAYFNGRFEGAVMGLAAGFLIEAVGGQGMSLLPLFYFLFGYVAGHYSRAVHLKRFVPYLFYLGCGLFLRAAATIVLVCLTYQNLHLPTILLQIVLPELLATAILGCVLYLPLKPICRAIGKGK